MTYKIGPEFFKPFNSECEARLTSLCEGDVYRGEQVAFVDDELACRTCLAFAHEQNEDEHASRAGRIRFRKQAADTGEINIIRGRE
jgi:hypothetical protein